MTIGFGVEALLTGKVRPVAPMLHLPAGSFSEKPPPAAAAAALIAFWIEVLSLLLPSHRAPQSATDLISRGLSAVGRGWAIAGEQTTKANARRLFIKIPSCQL
jgi:hypothetical protein